MESGSRASRGATGRRLWTAPAAARARRRGRPAAPARPRAPPPAADVALEPGRDQRIVRAPDEQRRRLELRQARVEAVLAEGLLEVDVARRAEEREASAGRGVGALELVNDDVADVRVDRVGVVEEAGERGRDPGAPEAVGEEAQLGAGEAD